MLFLGAGASAAFGVPTMQQLTENCEELLHERGFPDATLSKIKDSLVKFGFVPDFEAMLTVVQAFASPEEGVRTAGPLAAYLAYLSPDWTTSQKESANLVTELKRMLITKCTKVKMDEAINHYNKLFSMFANVSSVKTGPSSTLGINRGITVTRGVRIRTRDIFTTNYDLIVEQYFDQDEIRDTLKTGFVPQGMRNLWDPRGGYRWGTAITNLVKLHGSIDQFVTTAGIEKRQAPPTQGYYTSETLEEMMIFPVHEKYVTRRPYFDLFTLLMSRLREEQFCVVIGFSFRDEAVNNAFLDRISTNPPFKIVYVGGEKGSENVQRIPQIAAKTKVIPFRFGVHDESIDQIGQAIQYWVPD